MRSRVIAIHGLIGAGKDTVGKMIAEQLRDLDVVENRRFAEVVKENVSNMTGVPLSIVPDLPYANEVWDFTREQKDLYLGEWKMSLGQMLQIYATEAVRNILHNAAWIFSLITRINESAITVITDLRFENEIEWLKHINAYRIKVVRDSSGLIGSRDAKHQSEQGLGDEHFDYIIHNDSSLEDLREQVFVIVENIKKGLQL